MAKTKEDNATRRRATQTKNSKTLTLDAPAEPLSAELETVIPDAPADAQPDQSEKQPEAEPLAPVIETAETAETSAPAEPLSAQPETVIPDAPADAQTDQSEKQPETEPLSAILTPAEIGANLRTVILSIADETAEKAFKAVHSAFAEHLKADKAKAEAASAPFDEAGWWNDDKRAAEIVASAYLVPDGLKKDGITPKYKTDNYAKRIVGIIEPAFRAGIRTYENFKLAVARHRGSVASFMRECHDFTPVFNMVNTLAKSGLMRKAQQQAAYRLLCGQFGLDAGAAGAMRKLMEFAAQFELTSAQVKTVQAAIKSRGKAVKIAKLLKRAEPESLTWQNVFTITFTSEAAQPTAPVIQADAQTDQSAPKPETVIPEAQTDQSEKQPEAEALAPAA